jgi:ubiquinone/menaquinone biosynthesis C-methylase UbiE
MRNTGRRQYFDEAAATWDKSIPSGLTGFLDRFVPTFAIASGQKVLDVGTGTGILIPFLIEAVGPWGWVTAIDNSEKMLEVCRRKYSQLRNLTIQLQDVEELDLPSNSFDIVTCFGVFPHIENRRGALHQIGRVLRGGGRLVIAHALSSDEIRTHHHGAPSAVSQDVLPNRLEMTLLLRDSGFSQIHIEDEPGHYLCTSNKLL